MKTIFKTISVVLSLIFVLFIFVSCGNKDKIVPDTDNKTSATYTDANTVDEASLAYNMMKIQSEISSDDIQIKVKSVEELTEALNTGKTVIGLDFSSAEKCKITLSNSDVTLFINAPGSELEFSGEIKNLVIKECGSVFNFDGTAECLILSAAGNSANVSGAVKWLYTSGSESNVKLSGNFSGYTLIQNYKINLYNTTNADLRLCLANSTLVTLEKNKAFDVENFEFSDIK